MTDETPEGVLTPDDLELPDDHVTELAEDRFVVHPGGDTPDVTGADRPPEPATNDGGAGDARRDPAGDRLECPEAYGIAARVKTEHGIADETMRSNDVGEVFESFVRWYAGRIAPGRSPEEVLAVLVRSSDLSLDVSRE